MEIFGFFVYSLLGILVYSVFAGLFTDQRGPFRSNLMKLYLVWFWPVTLVLTIALLLLVLEVTIFPKNAGFGYGKH